MQERLKQRLETLKQEFETGQKVLAETTAKQNEIRNTLLRIQGAIAVLEEELNPETSEKNSSMDCA